MVQVQSVTWAWRVDFTLTFDSSPIKGEGYMVGVVLFTRVALWIDESPMNLYEILGFQPKGVATLSFSS